MTLRDVLFPFRGQFDIGAQIWTGKPIHANSGPGDGQVVDAEGRGVGAGAEF